MARTPPSTGKTGGLHPRAQTGLGHHPWGGGRDCRLVCARREEPEAPVAGATPALRPHDPPGTPWPRQAPASSTEALDPTALDVWPLPTHRLRAPCAQPPLPTAPPLWVPGAADLPGPFLQGPPGLAHLQPPPQEAASEPASSQTVSVLQVQFTGPSPPGSPRPSSPAAGSLPDVPLWPLLWKGALTLWVPQRASGGAGRCQEARGQGRPCRTTLGQAWPAHTGTLRQGEPRLPGLESGMTRGKWRREGLRGLWGQRWGE